MIDMIYNWLRGYPGLNYIQRDRVDEKNSGSGLFFRGVTLVGHKADLMGNLRCRKRLSFRIRRFTEPADGALFFLMLGQWAEETAPTLGMDQVVSLHSAHMVRDQELGLSLWEADLDITYTEEEL